MSSLKYVIVIPSGGGKTSLCSNPAFMDIDALYNLRETQSTYKRMNHELRRRAETHQPVPTAVRAEFVSRVTEYRGPATCLLVHSVTMADESGLELLAVLVPSFELHGEAISTRQPISRWFARRNVDVQMQSCLQDPSKLRKYSEWDELNEIIAALVPQIICSDPKDYESSKDVISVTPVDLERDEDSLLSLISTAVGCEFESAPRLEFEDQQQEKTMV